MRERVRKKKGGMKMKRNDAEKRAEKKSASLFSTDNYEREKESESRSTYSPHEVKSG